MTLKIEEGKFYRTRDGQKVGPMLPYAGPLLGDWRDSDGWRWYSYGTFVHGTPDFHRNLVSEWADETPQQEADRMLAEHQASRELPGVTKQSILDAASAAVADRGLNYGKPEDNFTRIAKLWNAHLGNRYFEGFGGDTTVALPTLDASDVAMMMILMKVARLEHMPSHMDSVVDIAGYAACLGTFSTKVA